MSQREVKYDLHSEARFTRGSLSQQGLPLSRSYILRRNVEHNALVLDTLACGPEIPREHKSRPHILRPMPALAQRQRTHTQMQRHHTRSMLPEVNASAKRPYFDLLPLSAKAQPHMCFACCQFAIAWAFEPNNTTHEVMHTTKGADLRLQGVGDVRHGSCNWVLGTVA